MSMNAKVKVILRSWPEGMLTTGLSTLKNTSLKCLGQFELNFICGFLTMGGGKECLFERLGSHDQGSGHTQIWLKPYKIFFY